MQPFLTNPTKRVNDSFLELDRVLGLLVDAAVEDSASFKDVEQATVALTNEGGCRYLETVLQRKADSYAEVLWVNHHHVGDRRPGPWSAAPKGPGRTGSRG